MDRNFKFNEAAQPKPVYFEQVLAEKPGGGILAAPDFEVKPTTALAEDTATGKYKPIKAYRLVQAVQKEDTTIKIAKGSGVKKGDIIAHGKLGVACTEVNTTTSDEYDVVTVTLGVAINADVVLYQAKAASADAAEPILTPKYVLGDSEVKANEGDQEVRLINAANIRKETANIADEVVAKLKSIELV